MSPRFLLYLPLTVSVDDNAFHDVFSFAEGLLDTLARLWSEIGLLEVAIIAYILALLSPLVGFKKNSGRWFTWPLMAVGGYGVSSAGDFLFPANEDWWLLPLLFFDRCKHRLCLSLDSDL